MAVPLVALRGLTVDFGIDGHASRAVDNVDLEIAPGQALGIVGVNLLYGAFFLNHEPEKLVESLLDSLSTRRLEIDMIEFSGIAFRHVDNRVMSLKLVQLGLSDAAMFSASVCFPFTDKSGNGLYVSYCAASFAVASWKCFKSAGVHQFRTRPLESNALPSVSNVWLISCPITDPIAP